MKEFSHLVENTTRTILMHKNTFRGKIFLYCPKNGKLDIITCLHDWSNLNKEIQNETIPLANQGRHHSPIKPHYEDAFLIKAELKF